MQLTPELAEVCGIHAGDGHLRKNRVEFEVSGGLDEKDYYDFHVVPLFKKAFGIEIHPRFMKSKGTYGFSSANKKINDFLVCAGFPRGNKSLTVKIPDAILNSDSSKIRRAFLRGLFDTDGCISFINKSYNSDSFKKYNNFYPRIGISTISETLANNVKLLLDKEQLHCTLHSKQPKDISNNKKFIIQVLGELNVEKWMGIIGSNNPSKLSRYNIWKLFGFCPSRTTYAERVNILKGELYLVPVGL